MGRKYTKIKKKYSKKYKKKHKSKRKLKLQKGGINILKVLNNIENREDLNYPTKYEIINAWNKSKRSLPETIKKLRKSEYIYITYDQSNDQLLTNYSVFFKNLLNYLRSWNPDYINEIHRENKLSIYMNNKRYIFKNLNPEIFPVWKDLSEINNGEYVFLLHNTPGAAPEKNSLNPDPLPKTKAYYSVSDYGVGNHKYAIPGIVDMFMLLNQLDKLPEKPEIYDNLLNLHGMIMDNFIRMMGGRTSEDIDNWFHILNNENVDKIIEKHSQLQGVPKNETSLNDIFLFALPYEWLKLNSDNRQLTNAYLTKNVIPLKYRLLNFNDIPKVESNKRQLPFTTEISIAPRDKDKGKDMPDTPKQRREPSEAIPDNF